MPFVRIVALLAVALTGHNIEEALWLPAWASPHGFWPAKDELKKIRFRGALLALTLAVLFLAGMSFRTGPRSLWTLLMLGTAAVVWANVFIPPPDALPENPFDHAHYGDRRLLLPAGVESSTRFGSA
jgi:hypothetical protein